MNDGKTRNRNARLCPGEVEKNAGTEPGGPNARTEPAGPNARTEPGGPNAGTEPGGPKGWHSRGYLPHYDSNEVDQHVTFHLADSLPRVTLERLASELLSIESAYRERERRKRLEALLDAGFGGCVLRRPDVAALVQESLNSFDGQRYHLFAWVVMPNHVHVLLRTLNDWSMGKIVASWKAYTGRRISDVTRAPGALHAPVWHREYWDRFIRDEKHFANVVAYIHYNPVKAGLATAPEDWRWSSARMGEIEKNAGTEPGGPNAGTEPGGPNAGTEPGGPNAGTEPGGPNAGTEPGGPLRERP